MTTRHPSKPKLGGRWALFVALALAAVGLVVSFWTPEPSPMEVAEPPPATVTGPLAPEGMPPAPTASPVIPAPEQAPEPVGTISPQPPEPGQTAEAGPPQPRPKMLSQKQRKRVHRQLQELLKEGRRMEELRPGRARSDTTACGQAMRAAQMKATRYSQEVVAIEGPDGPYADALSMASYCVSCEKNAFEACDDVEDVLRIEGVLRE